MKQTDIHAYLLNFFIATGCEIIDDHPAYLTIQLNEEMDKALMNRPFYWHYLKQTGGIPNPAVLKVITDPAAAPKDLKGDIIHFGSPRLHQIFRVTKEMAGYIRLYENRRPDGERNIALQPWLAANIKVSFVSDRKKDLLFSLGLHLLSGTIVEEFHGRMLDLQLTPKIPDFSFTLSPLIMPKSGITRLDRYVRTHLAEEDHEWAENAITKWENDLALLEHFYEGDEENDHFLIEKEALKQQYEPNINISIINGGMFYLSEQAL